MIEKRSIVFLMIALCASLRVLGVPALHKPFQYLQPDGKTLKLWLYGDETCHYFLTEDSVPVFRSGQSFCYGYAKNDSIVLSQQLAHDIKDRTTQETLFIDRKNVVLERLKKLHAENARIENLRRASRRKTLNYNDSIGFYTGEKKGLVILVEFPNLTMSSETSQLDFERLFNEKSYSENGCIGSVQDYFYDQSYGKFNLSFDVVGPVLMPENFEYYGSNSMITGNDQGVREMVVDACKMVDNQVDYRKYDWDGDGEVDQIYLIYAGYGEHAGASPLTIWPHESSLYNQSIKLDGVVLNTYACSCELRGNSGKIMTGIGTPCHEFSHCLGFPDLYDTDYSGAFGMSYWDIMNSGSHSGPTCNGEVPYGYSAFERWMAGWLTPEEITSSRHVDSLMNVGEVPQAYTVHNDAYRKEFLMIENHQNAKWFQYVGPYTDLHGMMVTHVDYDETAWKTNRVNPNSKHQRMSIIPADNSYGTEAADLSGDLFPSANNIHWLTSDSHTETGGIFFNPSSNGSRTFNRIIGSINEMNEMISFDVIFDGEIEPPVVISATDIDADGYRANWEVIEDAEYYTVEQTCLKMWQNLWPITKKDTIDYVHDANVRLNWIDPEGETKYRVRAKIKGMITQWSDYMDVKITTGVNDINSEDASHSEYFGIDGIKRRKLYKGLNIVRKGDRIIKVVK